MELTWRRHSACSGLDPAIFYPAPDEEATVAKMVCTACSVREMWLEFALHGRDKEGVWGGATEKERRRMLRQRRRAS